MPRYRVVEVCAGAGGQSLGLEIAGFEHELAVELDQNACATLRHNRPHWKVAQGDVASPDVWDPAAYAGVDLLAGGVPCPPFTIAGKQLGATDERDLFAWAIELCGVIGPRALLLENVRGLSLPRFAAYRQHVLDRLAELGYAADWRLLHAADYGVPQLRPRFVLVAMRPDDFAYFRWPQPRPGNTPTVGETLLDLMAAQRLAGRRRVGGEGERHRADHRRRVEEARRCRPGADPRQAGLARARRGRARRGRRRAVGRRPGDVAAQAHLRDGRQDPGLGRPRVPVGVHRQEDLELPADRQRLPAAGRPRARRADPARARPSTARPATWSSSSNSAHDPVYAVLRDDGGFLTMEQILRRLASPLDVPAFERHLAHLRRDFHIEVQSRQVGRRLPARRVQGLHRPGRPPPPRGLHPPGQDQAGYRFGSCV